MAANEIIYSQLLTADDDQRSPEPYVVAVDVGAGTSQILPLPEEVILDGAALGDFEVEIGRRGAGQGRVWCTTMGGLRVTMWNIYDSAVELDGSSV